jgi:isoleucyl-tRNA synthetase
VNRIDVILHLTASYRKIDFAYLHIMRTSLYDDDDDHHQTYRAASSLNRKFDSVSIMMMTYHPHVVDNHRQPYISSHDMIKPPYTRTLGG